jgi:hypothetical protein
VQYNRTRAAIFCSKRLNFRFQKSPPDVNKIMRFNLLTILGGVTTPCMDDKLLKLYVQYFFDTYCSSYHVNPNLQFTVFINFFLHTTFSLLDRKLQLYSFKLNSFLSHILGSCRTSQLRFQDVQMVPISVCSF